jgi:hypothetical protein
MWEIHQELSGLVEGDIPDRLFTRAVLRGLTSSILMAAPVQIGPWTEERLLWYADHLDEYLPKSDPHWNVQPGPDQLGLNFQIHVHNDDHVPRFCYKCGEKGHEAKGCVKKRLNYLRPKLSQKRNKKSYHNYRKAKKSNKNNDKSKKQCK